MNLISIISTGKYLPVHTIHTIPKYIEFSIYTSRPFSLTAITKLRASTVVLFIVSHERFIRADSI